MSNRDHSTDKIITLKSYYDSFVKNESDSRVTLLNQFESLIERITDKDHTQSLIKNHIDISTVTNDISFLKMMNTDKQKDKEPTLFNYAEKLKADTQSKLLEAR